MVIVILLMIHIFYNIRLQNYSIVSVERIGSFSVLKDFWAEIWTFFSIKFISFLLTVMSGTSNAINFFSKCSNLVLVMSVRPDDKSNSAELLLSPILAKQLVNL